MEVGDWAGEPPRNNPQIDLTKRVAQPERYLQGGESHDTFMTSGSLWRTTSGAWQHLKPGSRQYKAAGISNRASRIEQNEHRIRNLYY